MHLSLLRKDSDLALILQIFLIVTQTYFLGDERDAVERSHGKGYGRGHNGGHTQHVSRIAVDETEDMDDTARPTAASFSKSSSCD